MLKTYKKIRRREYILSNLTPRQEKIRNEKLYFSKLGITNPYILNQFTHNIKNQQRKIGLKQRYSMDKVHSFFNLLVNKRKLYHHKKKAEFQTNRLRTESLKMLYYNIYDMLVSIALRKTKYSNNNDDLTPYEQKFFRKFVKFILIFRYLKRIKLIPSAIILLNSDVHESQYTDFKSLNTAVIGIADSNIQFTSLSYYIPSNDDNLVLFLYYVKMLSHSFNRGRKQSLLENLTPKFMNNISRKINYAIPFVYQYDSGLNPNVNYNLLPFGSKLDKAHIERLEERRRKREEKQKRYELWRKQRVLHNKKKKAFWKNQVSHKVTENELNKLPYFNKYYDQKREQLKWKKSRRKNQLLRNFDLFL